MAQNHDALFRSAFSQVEHARGVLKSALPEKVASGIQWSSLRLAAGEFVDTHLTERKTDLLFEVQFYGASAFVHVLWEHQSRVDEMMAARLFTYIGRIWDRWRATYPKAKRLPAVLPVVLYQGPKPWTAPTSLVDVLDIDKAPDPAGMAPFLSQLQYFVQDLGVLDEAALRNWPATPAARLVLLVLRGRFQSTDIMSDFRRWADLFREAFEAPHGPQALEMVLRYVLEEAEAESEVVEAFVVEELGDKAREVYMTAAQRIREEGKAEGRVEGKAETVSLLLQLRFGELPKYVSERLAGASPKQLDAWTKRVLTASSLDAVFE